MRQWPVFIACLLLSASIWLVYNLSQPHSTIVSVEVAARSNIEGRAERSSDAVTMAARVNASGFRLLRIGMRRGVTVVPFDSEDLQLYEGDFFRIGSNQLMRYVADIYGPGTKVEAFLFDSASFRFARENNKRVAVRPVNLLSFRPQYAQFSPLQVKPDSVTVYGPSEVLERIDQVYTATISLSDIRSNIHGEVRLETPMGARLSEDKVEYSFEVSRYVEIETDIPVSVHNAPDGIALRVYPSTVHATFRCVFPLISNPLGNVGCYVDYNEFTSSITGHCVVRLETLPNGVLSCRLEPEVVDCVERVIAID